MIFAGKLTNTWVTCTGGRVLSLSFLNFVRTQFVGDSIYVYVSKHDFIFITRTSSHINLANISEIMFFF